MLDPGALRTSRELFLTIISGGATDLQTWVIDRMISLFEEEEVEAGRRVFEAGEPIEFIYFMREGKLRVTREGKAPWTYEGRWVIGPADALLERPYRRTGEALTDLSMLKLRVDDWIDLLEDSFELSRAAVTNAVRGVAALESRIWAAEKEPRGRAVLTPPHERGPLSFVDRLATFAEIRLLRGAGVQVLTDVVGLVEERTFPAGATLWERGELPGRVFFVIEGEVIADRVDPALTVRFGPGSVVAGAAAMGDPSPWEPRAVTETRTLSLHLEDWFDLMEEHLDLVRSALGGLAQVREEILEQLAEATGELVLG